MNNESQICSKCYGLTCKKKKKFLKDYRLPCRKTKKSKKSGSVCCGSGDYRFSENDTDPDPDPDYRPNPTSIIRKHLTPIISLSSI